MTARQVIDRLAVPLLFGVLAVGAGHNWRAARRTLRAVGVSPVPATNPAASTETGPSVSVLVAAWNEAETIERHIRSFLSLADRPTELVICAGGGDGTFERAQRMVGERVILLEQARGEGKQRSLQRCLEASRGELIMLTDADCELSEADVDRLLGPLVLGRADVVTGTSQPFSEQLQRPFVEYQWLLDLGRTEPSDGVAGGVLGRNCAVRRSILEELGAFRTPAPTGTDYVLSMLLRRAGIPISFVPGSRIQTHYPETPGAYLAMWRRWIKNVLVHGPRFGAWGEVGRTLVAVGIAAGTLASPLVVRSTGKVGFVGPLAMLGLASMNRMRRLTLGARRAGRTPSLAAYAYTPLMAVLDDCAVLLSVVDVVSQGGRKRW